MRKLLVVPALVAGIMLTGCNQKQEPTAQILSGYGTTICQVYVGNDGQASYWDGMRTCTLHEVEMHQALPVGQR